MAVRSRPVFDSLEGSNRSQSLTSSLFQTYSPALVSHNAVNYCNVILPRELFSKAEPSHGSASQSGKSPLVVSSFPLLES